MSAILCLFLMSGVPAKPSCLRIAYETHRSAVQSAHDNPFALVLAPLSVVYQRAKEGDSVRVPECHVLGIDFAEVMAVRGFVPQWS